MKKYCKNHPKIPAKHFILEEKPAKGFHGPAKIVTKIWLCEKCYYKTQKDLIHYFEEKSSKNKL